MVLPTHKPKQKKNHFCNFKNGFLFCGEFFFGLAKFQDQKKHSLKVENWSEVTSRKMMSKVMRRKKKFTRKKTHHHHNHSHNKNKKKLVNEQGGEQENYEHA